MARNFTRAEILRRLRKEIDKGKPIIGAGCSAGIIAKCAELGGADLIIVYSTGRSRIMGLPTLEIGHSNPITLDMYHELANVVRDTPIIGGLEACDPTNYDLEDWINQFIDKGFNGIINFPTSGAAFRRSNAEAKKHYFTQIGMTWAMEREFEMINIAHEKLDLFTMCYVFTPEDAAAMVKAGCDVVTAHVGGTGGGLTGFKVDPVGKALEDAQRIINGARAVDPNVICLVHGGPFAEPEDTLILYEKTDAQGFVGASSIERIPVERAVTECLKGFKNFKLRAK